METNVVLILVIGLPCAGKTTLCKKLCNYAPLGRKVNVIHICFDELIPLSEQKHFATEKQLGCLNSEWNWAEARTSVVSLVSQLVEGLQLKKQNDATERFCPGNNIDDLCCYFVLLDDNFYYRSMRYKFYQVARKYGAGFCSVVLECKLSEALQRNKSQRNPLPDGVIQNMASRFEPPCASNCWEDVSLILQSRCDTDLSCIWKMALKMSTAGVLPLEDHSQIAAAAQKQCSESVLHQADLILRKILKEKVEKCRLQKKGGGSSEQFVDMTKKFVRIRQQLLSNLRRGELKVPEDMLSMSDNNKTKLKDFLKLEFENMM